MLVPVLVPSDEHITWKWMAVWMAWSIGKRTFLSEQGVKPLLVSTNVMMCSSESFLTETWCDSVN